MSADSRFEIDCLGMAVKGILGRPGKRTRSELSVAIDVVNYTNHQAASTQAVTTAISFGRAATKERTLPPSILYTPYLNHMLSDMTDSLPQTSSFSCCGLELISAGLHRSKQLKFLFLVQQVAEGIAVYMR